MTHSELQRLLSQYDPKEMIGTTRQRFSQLYMATGVEWRDLIQALAEHGYRWRDAANAFNVKRAAIIAECKRRDLTFPWQGKQSWKYREQRSAAMEGSEPFYRPPKRLYNAHGVSGYADDLIKQFGHVNLTKAAFQSRVNQGWSTEEALKHPTGMPTGNGSIRVKAQQQKLQAMNRGLCTVQQQNTGDKKTSPKAIHPTYEQRLTH